MNNYSDDETERQLAALEKKIKVEYNKAWKELDKSVKRYFATFEKQVEEMEQALKDGTYPELYGVNKGITPEEHFRRWKLNHIGIGKRWEKLRDDCAMRMTHANEIASAYINGATPNIFALNHNYSLFEIEQGSGIAFDIYNEEAVKRLIEDENHTEFRTVSINRERDYKWNQKRIQSELLSGIVQGKSIKHLVDGFMNVMQNNRSAAIRNARTAVTSAQNGGRQDSFNKAVEMGIEVQKEWIATNDARTRDSHAQLDGVRVAHDKPFPNKLMYPADPSGAPAEVYNCRCAMRAITKHNKAIRTDKTVDSYKKWLESKNE